MQSTFFLLIYILMYLPKYYYLCNDLFIHLCTNVPTKILLFIHNSLMYYQSIIIYLFIHLCTFDIIYIMIDNIYLFYIPDIL